MKLMCMYECAAIKPASEYMSSDRTGDDGRVAGVVLRNVLLDLADQVSTHVSSLPSTIPHVQREWMQSKTWSALHK